MSEYFNPQRITSICEDDMETARSIAEMFTSDVPKRLEAAKLAITSGDMAEAKRNFHSIKGSSINIGAEKLGELASQMENNISDPAFIQNNLAEFSSSIANTIKAINAWLAA